MERWKNHLNPLLKRARWTTEEDLFILSQFLKEGKRWSKINDGLEGRTEHGVKNRWKKLNGQAKELWPDEKDYIERFVEELTNN